MTGAEDNKCRLSSDSNANRVLGGRRLVRETGDKKPNSIFWTPEKRKRPNTPHQRKRNNVRPATSRRKSSPQTEYRPEAWRTSRSSQAWRSKAASSYQSRRKRATRHEIHEELRADSSNRGKKCNDFPERSGK